jgi:serine/threonine protein kinase
MADFPRRWGAYVLIRPLGSGGMGSVFLALTGRPGMTKLCVVKRLNADTLSSDESLARFRREADIARSISHGAIAQTLAVDDVDGEPFIAQEFIEGRTLTQVVSSALSCSESIPPPVAVHIAREVARALAYAHRVAGIVHRDIAPDNVMVTFSGEVRLIDFGIARAGSDPSLTAPGSFVGRVSYTAPEVLAGKTADRLSDIYSLGVLLWELLVGRPAGFEELRARPAPSSLKPSRDLPAGLDSVVLQAIAAEPMERFASVEDLHRALGPFLPPTFAGESALAEFIARCYDVERERRNLRDDLLEASALLADSPTAAAGPSLALAEGRRTPTLETRPRSEASLLPCLFTVIGLAMVALAIFFTRRPSRSVANSEVSKRVEPAAIRPAPVVLPPLPPAPPAMAVPAKGDATTRPRVARVPTPRRASPTLAAGALLDNARDDLQAGDLTGAERDAQEVLRDGTPSQKSRAHLVLGRVLLFRGHAKAGADEFSQAIELDPQNVTAADELAQLRRRGAP